MNILGGSPRLVTDTNEISKCTGDEMLNDPQLKGVLVYPNGGYIFVRKDGQYHLMLDRSDYLSDDLPAMEKLLAEWYGNEARHNA